MMTRTRTLDLLFLSLLATLALPAGIQAQVSVRPVEPFKVGTFAVDKERFIGAMDISDRGGRPTDGRGLPPT
jgi:hypothetical protein